MVLPVVRSSRLGVSKKPKVMSAGAPRAYATQPPFFSFSQTYLPKNLLPSFSSRNVTDFNNHVPSYKLDSFPKLRNQTDYPAW